MGTMKARKLRLERIERLKRRAPERESRIEFVDVDPLDPTAKAHPDREQVLISSGKWNSKLHRLAEKAGIERIDYNPAKGLTGDGVFLGETYTEAFSFLKNYKKPSDV